MDNYELMSHVDHTLLKPEATWPQVEKLCDEAVTYGAASVCINPTYVRQAAMHLRGRVPVCTVIGFPLGANSTAVKVYETKDAIAAGAEEIDMVINIGRFKNAEYDYVLSEIQAIKKACGTKILKVIVEACLLTEDEKAKVADLVVESGADFIKTSTGFSTGGATFADVALFQDHVKNWCQIKAAGGIRTKEDMETFLQLGAHRLGTSSAVKILFSL